MTVTLHLADYLNNERLLKIWHLLQRWIHDLGGNLDSHFAGADQPTQIGASCGIVAARVLTLLRMHYDGNIGSFGDAVSVDVLKHANTYLATAELVPSHFRDTTHTMFLSENVLKDLGNMYMMEADHAHPAPLQDDPNCT